LIISDINLGAVDGFEVRKKILKNEALKNLCIPFVFLTTANHTKAVQDAYSVSCGGFFTKPNSMEELRDTIRTIVEYWSVSCTPGKLVAA
jgi:DNA-binding NarL/FixJ family response regulator